MKLLFELADKIKKKPKPKAAVLEFLQQVGILDSTGDFAEPYKHLRKKSSKV